MASKVSQTIAHHMRGNRGEPRAKRDLLSIMDLDGGDLREIFDRSFQLKKEWQARRATPILQGCTLAMIFEKSSLRTRSTFEIGIAQLGGNSIDLSNLNIGMGTRESVADIARNLDRWCDIVMVRTYGKDRAETVARETAAPVINALTDEEHPCQALADYMTLMTVEDTRDLSGFPIAYVGDGNNVSHSLMCLAALMGMDFRIAAPHQYQPQPFYVDWARRTAAATGARITITTDPREAVSGARAVYTDIWASMGHEKEYAERAKVFPPYQLNSALLSHAEKDAYVMHDLPARRGEEITDEVMDGPTSIILLQAEHRLHVQKGIMLWLAEKAGIRRYE
ncbi:MAG TPA: ornithine carbamoyltransferase [Candidatus Sumerlaeota bacterium]|nr:ornithine carbamoyltransferase [Candidatus Sumerlaeota bacterium]HNM46777.1 ornithine carbamoyltransferase [Candidatus Sumerlaeota bacterium]